MRQDLISFARRPGRDDSWTPTLLGFHKRELLREVLNIFGAQKNGMTTPITKAIFFHSKEQNVDEDGARLARYVEEGGDRRVACTGCDQPYLSPISIVSSIILPFKWVCLAVSFTHRCFIIQCRCFSCLVSNKRLGICLGIIARSWSRRGNWQSSHRLVEHGQGVLSIR
jgi:hypothetical protein